MRNHLVVANGTAVVAVGGASGTLSEIGLALKLGRPVAATGQWSGVPGVSCVATPEEAIDWISKRSEKQ
jgi:predicted Rossmann-fold nucleotide-binding protein